MNQYYQYIRKISKYRSMKCGLPILFFILSISTSFVLLASNIQIVFAVESEVDLYKNSSDKLKTIYSDLIHSMESAIKISENLLSNSVYKNNEAQEKITSAWDDRWYVRKSIEKIKMIHSEANSFYSNGEYKRAQNKYMEINKEINPALIKLDSISKKIIEAKSLDDRTQTETRSCFLFWCTNTNPNENNMKNGVNELGAQIKNIDNKKIESRKVLSDFSKKLSQWKKENPTSFDPVVVKQAELEKIAREKQRLETELRQKEYLAEQVRQEKLEAERKTRALIEQANQERIRAEQANQEKIRLEQEKRRLLEEARLKEFYEQQERQRMLEQQKLERAKNQIMLQANSYPLIKGLINGKLTFYVAPLHSNASDEVRNSVESMASWMDGQTIQSIKLQRVYSEQADITINWARDYDEDAIGQQIGSHLIVGLGDSNCYGEWRPFNGYTVSKIMWHEMGHALGYGHTNDRNNIMYKITNTKYAYDVNSRITLPDGYHQTIHLCKSGHYYFTTETTSPIDGYKVYVIPSSSSSSGVLSGKDAFYLECSAYESEMKSFSQNCVVERGSAIVVYNPSIFNRGNPVQINVKVYDVNPDHEPNSTFPSSAMYFSQEYIDYVRTLFR